MNILLGISGSISAYKSADLLRDLIRSHHHVRVVLTEGALEFVKPELFRYLGAEAVYLPGDDFYSHQSGVPHVSLAKWADVLAIAPLSTNTLALLSQGMCKDFLGSIFLAWRKDRPILLFPAMNSMMWEHPFTQEHVQKLAKISCVHLFSPVSGLLACGDEGVGKLMDTTTISELITYYNPLRKINKKILITTGATIAPLDPVRYMTNPSQGITGIALAMEYLSQGAEVTILLGHHADLLSNTLKYWPNCHLIKTPTTKEMLEAALASAPHADTIIAAAAVADFEFTAHHLKVKKESLTHLNVVKAVDILGQLLENKKPHQRFISFAAETETIESVWREKFSRKPVDLMIGNKVNSGFLSQTKAEGFGTSEGSYWFIKKESTEGPYYMSKKELAKKISDWDLAII